MVFCQVFRNNPLNAMISLNERTNTQSATFTCPFVGN